jgi:hypothetical protein
VDGAAIYWKNGISQSVAGITDWAEFIDIVVVQK